MIELVFIGGALVSGAVSGYFANRRKPEVKIIKEKAELSCPYCNIVITGLTELDKINHLGCINKSVLDIQEEKERAIAKEAAEKKAREAAAKTAKKYKVEIQQMTTKSPSYTYEWQMDDVTRMYHKYRWTVTLGGNTIDHGTEKYKAHAEKKARAAIALHKQNKTTFEVEA